MNLLLQDTEEGLITRTHEARLAAYDIKNGCDLRCGWSIPATLTRSTATQPEAGPDALCHKAKSLLNNLQGVAV